MLKSRGLKDRALRHVCRDILSFATLFFSPTFVLWCLLEKYLWMKVREFISKPLVYADGRCGLEY